MIEEAPFRIRVNGEPRVLLTCSPHDLDTLAIGHLVAEGWAAPADVHVTDVADGIVAVMLPPSAVTSFDNAREHALVHGCGPRHLLECVEPAAARHVGAAALPADAALLLRALFAATDESAPDGGVHGAAISDVTALLVTAWDVARHCAVDRAIGAALRADVSLTGNGLVVTARVSGTMALKCARAGVSWIVTRSIATSLAHVICDRTGIMLVERAQRRPSMHSADSA